MSANPVGWVNKIPWPMPACLQSIGNRTELRLLVERLRNGELGTEEDWVAAEQRWVQEGLTADDLLSMMDNRLPYEANIRNLGFPTTLAIWPTAWYFGRSSLLSKMIELYGQLTSNRARNFLGNMIHIALLHLHRMRSQEDSDALKPRNLEYLKKLYQELPVEHPIPLNVVLDCLGDFVVDILDFFASTTERGNKFAMFMFGESLNHFRFDRLGML